jgi:hypothetical protein
MIQKNPIHNVLIFLLVVALCHGTLWAGLSLSVESGDRAKNISVATADDIDDRLVRKLSQIVLAGWHLEKPVKSFNHENLWEQINGQADFFLSYDMVRMTLAVYKDSSNPGKFIHVSIYDMGNPTNAFGVFTAERQEETHSIDLGRESYRFGAHLFIWKGPFYVCLIASEDDSPDLQEINLLLATKLMDSLDDSGGPVLELEMLPRKDMVPGSEQYYRKDAMGLGFLNDTFTARYRKKGVLITFFITNRGNPAAAGDIIKRYTAYARKFAEGSQEIIRSGVAITLCDMDGSYDALFQKNGIVAGVTSIDDPEHAVDIAFGFWDHFSALSTEIQKK